MTDQPSPFLTIQSRDQSAVVTIDSPDGLKKWIGEEHANWQWVTTLPLGKGRFAPVRDVSGMIHALTSWAEKLKSMPAELSATDASAIAAEIQSYYENKPSLLSASTSAAFVRQLLTTKGPEHAVGALAVLGGFLVDFTALGPQAERKTFDGILDGIAYTAGAIGRADAEISRLTDAQQRAEQASQLLQQTASEAVELLRQNVNDGTTLIQQSRAAIEGHIAKFTDDTGKSLSDTKAALDGMKGEYTTKLDNIEATYNKKMALLEPVNYWREKRAWHRKMSVRYGIGTFVLAIGGGLGLCAIWAWLLDAPLSPAGIRQIQVWQVAAAGVSAAIFLGLMRFAVRLWSSAEHLAATADERVVMTTTYLALSAGGHTKDPEQLRLVLDSLFRPASTGLIKSDAMPATLVEIGRIVGKGG